MARIWYRRNSKINAYLHKASTKLVNHLVENNIDTLVIGRNVGIKQDISLGRMLYKKLADDGEKELGTALEILVGTLGFDKTFKIVQNSAKFYLCICSGEPSVLLSMLSQMK